jgi:hypothetical protein
MVAVAACGLAVTLGACATVKGPAPKDYAAFRAENPRSILVVPTLNNTVSVTAPEFFLSTISRPFAERGYYIFPAHMVKRLLEDEGLADPGLVHNADARRLEKLFGCDSVLFIAIQQWDSKYVVLSTTTTVKFDYVLKSCKTNEVLWKDSQSMAYSPQANSSGGGILGALIAQAVVAALEKGGPNYMPLTLQANIAAAATPGQGLPAGPYLAGEYQKDTKTYH